MSVSDQLGAMIFELRSAGSPLGKAKAIARAWRTVRRLSPTERKVLAQEAGFDGAEEMLESLATTKGGVAPALMMQLLNSLREKGPNGLSDLVVGLKDPTSRDAILTRGADAVARALEPESRDGSEAAFIESIEANQEDAEPKFSPPQPIDDEERIDTDVEAVAEPMAIEGEFDEEDEEPATIGTMEDEEDREEPSKVRESHPKEAPKVEDDRLKAPGTIDPGAIVEALESEPSLVRRLLLLREAIPCVVDAAAAEVGSLLEAFPQGWPRRRAMIAMIEADFPVKTGDALDLIERLNGPSDRRWCLAALIDRGGLRDIDVDRALAMTGSATLRQRIRRVSTVAL